MFCMKTKPKFKLITDIKKTGCPVRKSILIYETQGVPKMNYNGSAPPDVTAAQQVNIISRVFMYFILLKIIIFFTLLPRFTVRNLTRGKLN